MYLECIAKAIRIEKERKLLEERGYEVHLAWTFFFVSD
jgi:hypothetical protein